MSATSEAKAPRLPRVGRFESAAWAWQAVTLAGREDEPDREVTVNARIVSDPKCRKNGQRRGPPPGVGYVYEISSTVNSYCSADASGGSVRPWLLQRWVG